MAFFLDPLMDQIGYAALVEWKELRPLWLTFAKTPLMPYTGWNNTIVMGSILLSLILYLPVFGGSVVGIRLYRKTLREKIQNSKFMKALKTTKLYGLYKKYKEIREKVSVFS